MPEGSTGSFASFLTYLQYVRYPARSRPLGGRQDSLEAATRGSGAVVSPRAQNRVLAPPGFWQLGPMPGGGRGVDRLIHSGDQQSALATFPAAIPTNFLAT